MKHKTKKAWHLAPDRGLLPAQSTAAAAAAAAAPRRHHHPAKAGMGLGVLRKSEKTCIAFRVWSKWRPAASEHAAVGTVGTDSWMGIGMGRGDELG